MLKKTQLLILVFSFLVYTSFAEESKRAACPGNGNCNGHGACNNGVCQCNSGWQGSDCSVAVKGLTANVALAGQHVDRGKWVFYTITTSNGNGMVVSINQTNSGGDLDLYLLQNNFPTTSNYKYKDVTTSKNFQIIVDNAGEGTWYIGVYGYLATDFIITAFLSSNLCPNLNNCNSPNGQCVSAGVCRCSAGWAGADCSQRVQGISLGQGYQGSVGFRQWNYYSLQLTKSNNLRIDVLQSGESDVDLYVKFGNTVPTLYTYDYRDASLKQNFTILINEPSLGNWIIGFYGYKASNFSFTVSANSECPSKCSKHGSCHGSVCQCNSGYIGSYCQTSTIELSTNNAYVGYVDDNSWNYYKFTSNSISILNINIVELNAGDCDLYVTNNQNLPSKFQYDFKNIGTSNNFTLSINDAFGLFNIAVYGFSQCDYTLQIYFSNSCPGSPVCSGNGVCGSEGQCFCNTGYAGANCSIPVTTLNNGVSMNGAIQNLNSWNYYSLNIKNSSVISIVLKETNTVGYLWVFVGKGRYPDLLNYDYALKEEVNSYHYLDLNLPNEQTDEYIIAIYANPTAANPPLSYTLSAWYSPF